MTWSVNVSSFWSVSAATLPEKASNPGVEIDPPATSISRSISPENDCTSGVSDGSNSCRIVKPLVTGLMVKPAISSDQSLNSVFKVDRAMAAFCVSGGSAASFFW
jgi:hypothetical protein